MSLAAPPALLLQVGLLAGRRCKGDALRTVLRRRQSSDQRSQLHLDGSHRLRARHPQQPQARALRSLPVPPARSKSGHGRIDRPVQAPKQAPPSPRGTQSRTAQPSDPSAAAVLLLPAWCHRPPDIGPRHSYRARSLPDRSLGDGALHVLQCHRRTVIPECAIQATNGLHRDDSNLMAQNDVTHPVPGTYTERFPYGLGQRRLPLRCDSGFDHGLPPKNSLQNPLMPYI